MANQVERLMGKIKQAEAARSIAAPSLDAAIATDLQRIRDELRALPAMSRRRDRRAQPYLMSERLRQSVRSVSAARGFRSSSRREEVGP